MPVELRKRKARAEPAPPPPAKKKSTAIKNAASKVKAAVTGSKANGSAGPPAVGSTIDLEGFGGEVETQDGLKTTLAKLVGDSKSGVVLFTYPKASTPGCKTDRACFY
jgi:thioredoxin-dependent peroxiredoxin